MNRKPKGGVLLIASPRFRDIGEGCPGSSFDQRQRKRAGHLLDCLKPVTDVVYPGIVYTREDVQRVIRLFFEQQIDYVLAAYLSWAEDFSWVRFLRDMPNIPVLFLNPSKETIAYGNTIDDEGFTDFLCDSGLVGALEASGSIGRIGRPKVKVFSGGAEEIKAAVATFAKASALRSDLRRQSVGLLSGYNELMWSTFVDPYNLFAKIGPETKFLSYLSLVEDIKGISDRAAAAFRDELSGKYRVMEDVDPQLFLESARASLGLAAIAKKSGICALIFNDVDRSMLAALGLRPGFYAPWFEEAGAVLTPEADIGGGLICYALEALSGSPASFVEPFHTMTSENAFTAGHGGPQHYTQDPESVIIARDIRFAKSGLRYAGAPFAWYRVRPGLKTMAHLSENNGTYRIICAQVEALAGEHFIASYSHGEFKPYRPVNEFFQQILQIGATQHFGVVPGDHIQVLRDFAFVMGFDFHCLDEDENTNMEGRL